MVLIAENRTLDPAHPALSLWQASLRQPRCDPFLVNCAAPSPLERFGIQATILRRQLGIERTDLAQKAGMDLDDLVAIEMGAAELEEVLACLAQLNTALRLAPCFLSYLLCEMIFSRAETTAD